MNVLIADAVSPAAVDVLKAAPGLNVIVSNKDEFRNHLADAEAILVRSAVKVTPDVFEAAPKLKVVGRAGVGVDNVDIVEATNRGVVVMNTPGGNAIAVAEHSLGFMLALARSIHLASASTKAGKWEKKKFLGNELQDKTLGIVGLGNIGQQVARRARPFGMKIVAYDPFVSADLAKDRGIEMVTLDELYAQADYISLHVALTDETRGMINSDTIARMKDGVRIVNCARGELVNSSDLDKALESGKVAGAALDVFETEPPGESPLFRHANVIATPHIGGSTEEAQENVGIKIAQQVRDYLIDGVVLNAVNMPSVSAEQYAELAPYLTLAERLGKFVAQISNGRLVRIKLTYAGDFSDVNAGLIRNAALAGVLNRFLEQKANLINANGIAKERGIGVSEVRRGRARFSDSIGVLLETEERSYEAEGAVFPDGSARLLSVDGIYVEAPLEGHMLMVKNQDVPGVIGKVGTILGDNGINISDFALGRGESEAIAAVKVDSEIPKKAIDELEAMHAVRVARAVNVS
ncbi:MAG: phosphoglycerate dehydrogenase [Acidobacteria bacterium]|nr:phosphoglycerate dehydrogenase [Acidobacteriota bacterium]